MNSYNFPKILKRPFLVIVLAMMTFFGYVTSSFASVYYVSPDGSNSNTGTKDSPWKTISKASDNANAGDQIIIRKGYYAERIIPKKSGTPGKFIIYKSFPNEKVTIDGANVAVHYWGGLIDVSNRNYIKIMGLNVINSKQSGIFGHEVNNIIISKCSTYNTKSSGIGMHFGSNITIDSNEVELANTEGNQENITVNSVVNFQISNNHVHNGGKSSVGGEGIDAKGDSSNGKIYGNKVHGINRQGIYIDAYNGNLYNIEVYNNLVFSNVYHGIQIGNEVGGHLENVRIYNNVVHNNEWSGIHVWGGGLSGYSHAMTDVYIVNNTIVKNGWTEWGTGISTDNTDIKNLVIRNNIVSQNTGLQIQIDQALPKTNYIVQNNLIDNSNRNWRLLGAGDTLGFDNINALPRFKNESENDFSLAYNSPAIGKGLEADNPGFDFKFKSRALTNGVDIGAFER